MSLAASSTDVTVLRVLLLEDSAFDAELLTESLRVARPDVELTWVSDEDAFHAALRERSFDVLLSDFQLGGGYTGLQALQHAQRVAPDAPFIFVSGVIGEENAVELLKKGATDYVIKGRLARLPVAIDRAMAEVREQLARRLAESQLRQADALYARVVDSLQDYAVILLDREGLIRSWNRAGRMIFGYGDPDSIGRGAGMLYTAQDRASGALERALTASLAQGSSRDERWLCRADGSQIRGDVVITPLSDSDDRHSGYSMLVRDVTAAYHASQALQAAKDEAERANAAKDRFLAVLSHELRTPLTPITTAAHVLERQAQVPERYAHLLPMIKRNVALEAKLIEDLLDITAISAGKLMVDMHPVAMHPLICAVTAMLESDASAKGIVPSLQLDAHDDLVDGDEARLQQVIWNIVRNAIKFTPEGGSISLTTTVTDGRFVLRCKDSGIGIEAEALPRIFTAFEQADANVRQRFGGLGLGLSIAKALTARHGGTLVASSEGAGQGATFEFALPLIGRSFSAVSPVADRPAASRSATAGLSVLLVEDNPDTAQALTDMLVDFGCDVRHAGNLRDARAALADGGFGLVLTDLGLPDGSGVELAPHVPEQVPILALSGYGTPRDLSETTRARFAGHVVKPADPETLRRAIEAALAGARS